MGVDVPPPPDAAAFRRKYGLDRPYALYAGRIDAGKGCAELVAHYARYRARGGTADLVLIGTLAMALPPVPGLRHLGYLSEDEKHAALAGASVVACPSAYESLSIALLEGFAVGTPGLVNAASAVLKEHCLRSNAGSSTATATSSRKRCSGSSTTRACAARWATRGGATWRRAIAGSVVLDRYRTLIEAAAAAPETAS